MLRQQLQIGNQFITVDGGMVSLNDLHRLSGGEDRHVPAKWLRLDHTKELVSVLIDQQRNLLILPDVQKWTSEKINDLGDFPQVIKTVNSFTQQQGTFVCRELAIDYAMWVSPAFELQVIHAYLHSKDAEVQRLRSALTDEYHSYARIKSAYCELEQQFTKLAKHLTQHI